MPLTPTATRDLLAQLGHLPKRFLGQNFLVDGNIVRKSLELAEVSPGDAVVEIGPGLGTLTSALLTAGAEVWAVEKDRTLHAHLEATLAPAFPATFHLLEGDAIEHPLAGLTVPTPTSVPPQVGRGVPAEPDGLDQPVQSSTVGQPDPARRGRLALPDQSHTDHPRFKVVANLPYAISTPWMDAILGGPLPARLVLMLQLEAAQRYAAAHGSKQFSAISIFLQSAYDLAPGHKVASGCFYPKPDVDSYLLHLVRKPAPFIFPAGTKTLIRACFQQRRKQVGSLLRQHLPDGGRAWLDTVAHAGVTPQTRPEDIPVSLWTRLVASAQ
jgi:16S rRNA (adenine1518-N6/adenine1519-N6)-dimethyltransferase